MPQPEITTPAFLHLTAPAAPDRPAVNIRAVHERKTNTYVSASVSIEHPMVAVTPTRIAKMRLGTVRRDALRAALAEANTDLAKTPAVKSYFKGTNGRAVSEKVKVAPTGEHLEAAALVYRLAKIVGDFPVQAVARCFGLERTDASRWIAAARKSGVLA